MIVRLLLVLLFARPAAAWAWQGQPVPPPRTAVLPERITVGDVFHAAVRLEAPPGATVVFPDSLDMPADVEPAGRRHVRIDSVAGGGFVYTAVYPLTAWRPDSVSLGRSTIEVVADGGQQTLAVTFPKFAIRSVLPADTAGIQPEPPKDVLGANRLLWPFLLALALLLAAIALAYWLYRRRRAATAEPGTAIVWVPPRERALLALDQARESGLLEAGAMKEFYSRVSDALRRYLDAIEPRWGAELTTSELAGRMRGLAQDPETAELLVILGEADLVKFARRRPVPADALARWTLARAWVERFEWPPAPAETAELAEVKAA